MGRIFDFPMKEKHIKKIKEGKKWTTLRSLRYRYGHLPCRPIYVPRDLTPEIVKSEGYDTKETLIQELKSLRFKLPVMLLLYDLRKHPDYDKVVNEKEADKKGLQYVQSYLINHIRA